ncbi:WD40-repeat-containing domain protein [Chiua virens]|nr:WD40-repeat-containing domain protein [Chiua virens]
MENFSSVAEMINSQSQNLIDHRPARSQLECTRVRVWRMDHSSDTQNEYPFACQTVIDTGHMANVFSAHMLPSSTRIATVAGDKQVRVFDVGESVGRSPSGSEMRYSTRQACIRVLRCHSSRTKRIITEDSPDFFLTVAEDGQVRQHDLRTPHVCGKGTCPPPLVKLPHELSTIALSPLTPYQFVVGGESPFAHLFDRRHIGRHLQEEWGMLPSVDDATTCVRRFSRYSRAPGEAKGYEHITGARMSAWNGHELLLLYLYSTRDEPGGSPVDMTSCILPPNSDGKEQDAAERLSNMHDGHRSASEVVQEVLENLEDTEDAEMNTEDLLGDSEDGDMQTDEAESEDDGRIIATADMHLDVAVIFPRMRFSGHSNVETVKDVNFLGPCDEYVTSGSDDGNFFIWKKSSGELVDILEGDEHIVNVIEGHPTLPLVAVSGIDTTVKLFAPARGPGPARYSRYRDAASVIRRNDNASRRGLNHSANLQFARLLLQHQDRALEMLRGDDDDETDSESRLTNCVNQ